MVFSMFSEWRVRKFPAFVFLVMLSGNVFASVTMLGSRVIYPAGVSSVDIQIKNNDDIPYVVQTWFDEGNIDANPTDGKRIPFVATPPVFRIQAKAGQVLRVTYTGSLALPQDRESVFWFNFLQVPPVNLEGGSGQNKMLVMLRNRVKVFYRPASIDKPENQLKGLKINVLHDAQKGVGINIENPQPWYASLANIDAHVGGNTFSLNADMISPFSNRVFWFGNGKIKASGNGSVTVRLVNDQGAWISEQYHVTFP